MLILCIRAQRCERVEAEQIAEQLNGARACADGFIWMDLSHEELIAAPATFHAQVKQITGKRIHDLHIQDAVNLQHPSYFDSTSEYDMLVFRKLVPGAGPPLAEARDGKGPRRRYLNSITTQPITFFLFERTLVTVRNVSSKTVESWQARLLDLRFISSAEAAEPIELNAELNSVHIDKQRRPQHPDELALRLLNGMVDRYLELRQPLTDRIDRWQRDLLDPRVPFSRWTALLDARIELRKLQNLCEEQYDALQELRDHYLDATPTTPHADALQVRVNDVMEHVQRVLSHARRLEASAESAVQLHFSATAYRTNQVVRTLTVITAVFAPLNLITGVFGMNFMHMPLLADQEGFWIMLTAMAILSTLLLTFFGVKRYLSDEPTGPPWRRWARWWRHRRNSNK